MTETENFKAERSQFELDKIQAETALIEAKMKYSGVRFYIWVAVAFAVGMFVGTFVI